MGRSDHKGEQKQLLSNCEATETLKSKHLVKIAELSLKSLVPSFHNFVAVFMLSPLSIVYTRYCLNNIIIRILFAVVATDRLTTVIKTCIAISKGYSVGWF